MGKILIIITTIFCIILSLDAKPNRDILSITPLSQNAKNSYIITQRDILAKYRIFSAVPKHGDVKSIIFLLDGNAHFPIALNILAQSQASHIALIGVGYAKDIAYDVANRRLDYTPKVTKKELQNDDRFYNGGGAQSFFRILNQDIIPQYISKYKHAKKILFGHSFGGLFCLYTYFNHSSSFDSYYCASASLWWGEGEILNSLNNLKSNPKLTLSIAELEKPQKHGYSPIDINGLYNILQQREKNVDFVIFKDRNHGNVIADAIKNMLSKNGVILNDEN